MALAINLERYLIRNGVSYEVVAHRPTGSSAAAARTARVSGASMAKSVLLKDEEGYLLAVIPANSRLHLGQLHRQLHRKLALATEPEVQDVFRDCSPGAVPPLGAVYGVDVVVDERLLGLSHVYFEGGDHVELVKIDGDDFARLLAGALRGRFSDPPAAGPRLRRQVSAAP